LNELIPELNKCIDQLKTEAVEAIYFDQKQIDPEKMPEILKNLDAKMVLFKQYEETSIRYNDW